MKKLFTTRLNRIGFFLRGIIFNILFAFLLALNPFVYKTIPGYFHFLLIVGFIYSTSLIIRRLRDIGLNVWWFVVVFIFSFLSYFPITEHVLLIKIISLLLGLLLLLYPGKKE